MLKKTNHNYFHFTSWDIHNLSILMTFSFLGRKDWKEKEPRFAPSFPFFHVIIFSVMVDYCRKMTQTRLSLSNAITFFLLLRQVLILMESVALRTARYGLELSKPCGSMSIWASKHCKCCMWGQPGTVGVHFTHISSALMLSPLTHQTSVAKQGFKDKLRILEQCDSRTLNQSWVLLSMGSSVTEQVSQSWSWLNSCENM